MQSLGIAHISTGDMLRERVASGDALGMEVAGIMQSGGLVPDEMVNRMVEDRIEQPDCGARVHSGRISADGGAGGAADRVLRAQRIRPVVVHLKVDYNVIIARLSGRRQCPTCGALYSVSSNAPAVSEVCDYDGSKLVVRDDDRRRSGGREIERLRAANRARAGVS